MTCHGVVPLPKWDYAETSRGRFQSAELALARIRDRVETGGHDVPERDVRRRYPRTLRTCFEYTGPSWIPCIASTTPVTPRA